MINETRDELASMLRESARDFAAHELNTGAFRERMGQLPGYGVTHFDQMLELGWRSVLIREELGGAGLGVREVAAIVEELGSSLLGDVLLATSVLPISLLQDGAALDTAAPLLNAAATGDVVLALAWQEDSNSLDPGAIHMRARNQGSGYTISGAKFRVAGAPAATHFLVSARTDDGIGVFNIPRDAVGVSVQNCWQVDGSASQNVYLHDVLVEASAQLLAPAKGLKALTRAIDATAVALSAELLGVATAAFKMTIAYMNTRVQYDKPIGSFQALQHKAVDLLVQRELAASVLEEALNAFDQSERLACDLSRLASRCKARCSDAALRITRECIQLHGAIGYTHEYDLGLYVKRALVLAAWLGNAGQHRKRYLTLRTDDEETQ